MTDEARTVTERVRRIEEGMVPHPETRSSQLRQPLIADRMDTMNIPGVSVAVVNEGALEWARGYGVREADQPDPVTPATLFRCCSISKMVTALGVLRLVVEGRIGLDDDVNEHLRSWKVPKTGDWQPRVTLRHLLSHTAGIGLHGGAGGYPRDAECPTLLQVLNGDRPSLTAAVTVTMLPGLTYRYSPAGYAIVQQLVEDLTRLPFEMAMQELVLDPLEMRHSTFAQPLPEPLWDQAAAAHLTLKRAPDPDRWSVEPEQAAGGLWTTAADLCQVILEMQRCAAGKPGQVITPEIARQMLTLHTDNWNCGLGIYVFNDADPASRYFSHGGAHLGWRASLIGYVQGGKGAVVLVNNGYTGSEFISELLGAIAHEYGWQGYLPPETAFREDAAPIPEAMGTYRLGDRRFLVEATAGGICLTERDQNPLSLRATTAGICKAPAGVCVGFRQEEARGWVLLLRQGGREWQLTRESDCGSPAPSTDLPDAR
jgi:CubicO group peptidase (beta-lactamase class C family)